MAKKVNRGNAVVEIYGLEELLKKLKLAEGDIKPAVKKALKESAKPVANDLLEFVERHSPGGSEASKWATGDTLESWNEEWFEKEDYVKFSMGFNMKEGGVPAIFLNYGGIHNSPYLFIEKAVDDNIQDVLRAQRKAIEDALGSNQKGKK